MNDSLLQSQNNLGYLPFGATQKSQDGLVDFGNSMMDASKVDKYAAGGNSLFPGLLDSVPV